MVFCWGMALCYLVFSVFLFFFTLWITQLLGLGGSQNRQHKTGKMTLPTKEQVKIALAIATVGVAPLVSFLIAKYAHRKAKRKD